MAVLPNLTSLTIIPFFISKIILPSTSSNFPFYIIILISYCSLFIIPYNIPRFILSSTFFYIIFIISILIPSFSLISIISFSLPNLAFLIVISSLICTSFYLPLSALPVPHVQELTLASLTCPLLGALRAAIGIKYSFISFITFILIRLSLNKSLIEPYY